jgi:hypothetical protein
MSEKNKSVVFNPFDWTLTHKESIFNKVKTYEVMDKKYLYGFINTGMGITYRDNKRYEKIGIQYQDEQKQMLNFLKLESKDEEGKFMTSHSLPKHKWGRVKPQSHLSFSVFHRKTRHTFAKENYVDIDMVNCHSNIYLSFAKHHNLPHEALTAYCLDPKLLRKSIIEMHLPDLLTGCLTSENESKMKDIAKNLPIRLANGGTYKQWKIDNNISDKLLHPDILKIESELNIIMDKVYEHNKGILQDIIKDKGSGGSKKNKRTVMSLWSQTIERYLQECAVEWLSNWYDIEGIIPCQDGLMIEKKHYYEGMVDDINAHVKSVYPYDIKFMAKALDEGISIPKHDTLGDHGPLTNDDETRYFELDYEYYDLHQEKLDISYSDFEASDVFIVQSGTGTGKSTLVSKLFYEYKANHPESNILCLSNLTSILDQLRKTFDENGTKLVDYSKAEKCGEIINRDATMCINSIMKIVQDDYSDTVLYIDEPTNLLFGMCNNSTIRNIKGVTACFIDLFKNAKKVVLTDAHMVKGIEDLIKLRDSDADCIYYYVNTFKKFNGINATNIEDSDLFVKNLIDNVKSRSKFICACDSKTQAESLYSTCMQYSVDEQNKFVLITADTKDIEVNDVDYSNSYVFLSPRVTCGVSIVTSSSLDSYIYISGKSINPITLYQQCTRNRNMRNLFYHIEDKNKSTRDYLSYKTCVEYHSIRIQEYEDLTYSCTYVDKYEKLQVQENFYFNLYCHKEYCESLMFKNLKHCFENELSNAGFVLQTISTKNDSNYKEELKEGRKCMEDRTIDDLQETIEDKFDDLSCQSGNIRRCRFLNICTAENVRKYRDIITCERLYENYNQFEKVLRGTEYVKSKITELKVDKFSVDIVSNSYCKVLLLKNLEEALQIKSLDIDNFTCTLPSDKGKLLYLGGKIKTHFKLKTGEITDVESCKKVYLKIVKNLSGGLGLLRSERSRDTGKRLRNLIYDCTKLQHFIDLVVLKNKHNLGHFNLEIIKTLQEYITLPHDINFTPPKKPIETPIYFDDE